MLTTTPTPTPTPEPTSEAGTVGTKPETWTNDNVTAINDGNGGVIPLPKEFHYVGGDIGTGIVISDKEGDTMDATGLDMGNQFVWIPATEADLVRTKFDSDGVPMESLDTTKYTEPYAGGYDIEEEEYNTMHEQVIEYGGFYMGRFEAGIPSTEIEEYQKCPNEVVCKRGVAPRYHVPWGSSASDPTPTPDKNGAVNLAKCLSTNYRWSSVVSCLCYGCQWDAMCRYIGDCQRTNKVPTSVHLTGAATTDVSKNLFDLAGNLEEWTMEWWDKGDVNNNTGRVARGGRWQKNR